MSEIVGFTAHAAFATAGLFYSVDTKIPRFARALNCLNFVMNFAMVIKFVGGMP